MNNSLLTSLEKSILTKTCISSSKEAEKGIEGFEAQPTYHGYDRVAIAQVKWSCPSLPAFYPGKTRAYKVYNANYS